MVAYVLASLVCLLAAELPGEGTLPGQKPPPRQLPSEATLPPGMKGTPRPAAPQTVAPTVVPPAANATPPAVAPPSVPPPATDPPRSHPNVASRPVLPPESALPAGMVAVAAPSADELLVDIESDSGLSGSTDSPSDQPGVDAGGKPGAPAAGGPAAQPWLRLNMRGHVGLVRAITFTDEGGRLCTAGDDKAVEVWAHVGAPDARWVHERAIRWQVQRGPRGRIHALAAAPGVLALAGYGAMGAHGEIWLVDPASGELKRALIDEQIGHRQPVVGLAFPRGRNDLLASQDVDGRVLIWRQDANSGLWTAKQLVEPDASRADARSLTLLQTWRRFGPIAMPDDRHVAVASHINWKQVASRPDPLPTWTIELIDVNSGERSRLQTNTPHDGAVMALAASPSGRTLVSSDVFGNFHVWNVAAKSLLSTQRLDAAVSAFAFSNDGRLLCTGSHTSPKRDGKAVVQVWDTSDIRNLRRVSDQVVERDVTAIAVEPNSDRFAYSQGSNVLVQTLAGRGPTETLRGLTGPVLKVAFAVDEPLYRIAIGTSHTADGGVQLEHSFDLEDLKLDVSAPQADQKWLGEDLWKGDWSLQSKRDADGESHWLYRGEEPAARLPLHPTLHGRPTAVCWIPDRAGRPFAVAVGTSLQGNVLVFKLEAADKAIVLRQFRGHEGTVRSVAVSRDRRYLASGSDDATVRVWNLEGFDSADGMINRWGARFEIRDQRVVAVEVREDGPLHFRGLRTDDVVHSVAWINQGKVETLDQPQPILSILQTASPDTQVVFDIRRRDMVLPGFQSLPAWRDLAALFIARNREWAFWTPAGYYDASFEGHKLFGWQVNQSVDALPDFFLAAQFRQALERPQVMSRLLDLGSLPAAMRAADAPNADANQDAVIPQYRLKPHIEILEPAANSELVGNRATIRARVEVREGLQLVPPKAFANGVVAPHRRLVEQKTLPNGNEEYVFEWEALVPSDPSVQIQIVASTDAEAVEFSAVQVSHRLRGPRLPGRLYVVAAGVNEYRDAQIQRLDFATSNVQKLVDVLRQSVGADATMLLDDAATRPMWTLITTEYAARLREEVSPDDLLVFFLSGHGVRDEQTDGYFFVPSNARYDDLRSGRYGDCLSFADFAAFADVPCRKLVVLDTCHAGAVQQPLRQQDLKAALRALQDDVVFTMTASEGSQEAAEDRSRQLGRFTARLIDALQGAADVADVGGNADGLVSLREAGKYVQAMVAAESARDAQPQHPTLGPIDLIDYADFPLTRQ